VEHDGRLLVTQVFGSQVTAIDTASGAHTTFAPMGAGISAPDDGVFGEDGTFYATEPMNATVSARNPDGTYRTLRDDLPAINGITMDHRRRRLFADEFRPGGRLWELDPAGRKAPVLLLDELMTPNALAMGPDGALWFPSVAAGEIWRYDLDERSARCVFRDLASPVAVKFDARGRLVTPESGTGEVTRIDITTGERELLAGSTRGIDNIALSADDRLFVSHFTDGRVAEWGAAGERVLSPSGLVGPFGIAVGPDGAIVVADGLSIAVLRQGEMIRTHTLLGDLPTLAVDVALVDGEPWVLGARGQVLRCAVGSPVVAVAGRLTEPTAIAADAHGGALVVEKPAGRVVRVPAQGGEVTHVVNGLSRPHGIALAGDGAMWITTADALLCVGPDGEVRSTVEALAGGQGVAVAADGAVLVALPARRRLVLHRPGGADEVLVDGAPLGAAVAGTTLPLAHSAVVATTDGWLVGCGGDGSIRRLRHG
jgi:sugar lactone lactonase YvrE